MHWRQCHQRSGEPIWVNLGAVRWLDQVTKPETHTRLWFGRDDHIAVREAPAELLVAASALPDLERSGGA